MEKKKLKGYGLSTVKGKEIFNIQNFQNNFLKTGRLFRDATNIKKIFTAWKSILLWIPLIFFLGVEPGYAIDATLQWSANTEPDLAGYRVFCREEGQYYNYTNPSWEGTNTICTIYDLDETKAYYFVARAFDIEELESGNSNEVYLEAAITPYNKNPIAYADPDLTSGIAPFTVTFDGSGSYDPDGEIVSYDWDFGDGTTDMGERVSYTFMDTGVYTVILTVADNQGATDSDTIRITAGSSSLSTCVLDIQFQQATLTSNITYYTDRDYELTNIPSEYIGLDTVITPNDDRNLTDATGYLTFEMPYDGTVFVAFDSRADSLPDWMNGFIYTGYNIYTSLSTQPHLKVYSKSYSEGDCINFGANKAPGFSGGVVSNYIVFW